MATITELLEKIKSLSISELASDSINETSETAADLNAMQMFQGIRSDGKEINPQYSPFTVEQKKKKGQVTDRVTLRDTGSFYEGLVLKANKDTISFFSTDEKSDKLEKKYGKQIFGLTNENKKEYVKGRLKQVFFKKAKEITKL